MWWDFSIWFRSAKLGPWPTATSAGDRSTNLAIGCVAALKQASGFAVTTDLGNPRRFRIGTDHESSAKAVRSGSMRGTFGMHAGSGFK